MNREHLLGLLARSKPAPVVALADDILAALDDRSLFHLSQPPVTGVVSTQVREPLAGHRFLVGDVVATQAEVVLDGVPGWGMCVGADKPFALALALCDAEIARDGDLAPRIRDHAEHTDEALKKARAEEFERLRPTIVEFEEIA